MRNTVCAIIRDEVYYFLQKRNSDKSYAGKWEFPGGGVESNERFCAALVREVKEELGVDVVFMEHIFSEEGVSSNNERNYIHWYVVTVNGPFTKIEATSYGWYSKEEIMALGDLCLENNHPRLLELL